MATEHVNRVYVIARVMHPNWSDLDLDPPFPLCVRQVSCLLRRSTRRRAPTRNLRRVNAKRGIGACPRRSTTDVVSCAHTRPTRRAIR